jgi:hypothetical protein
MVFFRKCRKIGCKTMISIAPFSEERSGIQAKDDPAPVRIVGDSENRPESEDDHRMRVNLFAAVAIIVLITVGMWLANALVETQRAQGCYSSGARTCSLI